MLKNMNKTTKNNMITYLMVIVVYAVIQVLVTSGSLSSLFTGLLVPICTYIILAISLNLVVGFLGELSLGHAGFMCIGAFTSAFFYEGFRVFEHGAGWKDFTERTTGNQRNTERQYIYYRIYINSDHTCHCSESDQLQNRTRDHGDS